MKNMFQIRLCQWLAGIVLTTSAVACTDTLENPLPEAPKEQGVPVELSFGFADEDDGYTLGGGADTRSGKDVQTEGFSAQLMPHVQSRAGEDLKPDGLYELHVNQYDLNGNLIKTNYTSGKTELGKKLTFILTQVDDCQLLVIVRGTGNKTPAIGGALSAVQKLTMASSIFEGIPTSGATQTQMNKMPYVLHLPHVKVTSDGKLQSIEGSNDARLLLKRLATKLTVNWNLDRSTLPADYLLKEVKLCQIPAIFGILPAKENTEWGTTWPSTVTEFVEPYRLTDAADLAKGTKTIWIPANVRGTSAKATSPYYRTKDNAPAAASYMELVLDNSVKKERLYYRAYLGGEEPTDFNLYENTDYNWTINIKSANYQTDNRIQLLDQTPVVSTNLVPTSNCFMMPPGTNICFNPYKHEAGTNGWNDYLVNTPSGTPSAKSAITSVKVLWQTKDAGTSGELVLGYVVDGTHHENLVNIENASDINKARISIKVPQTQGGNAVVAAYNGTTVLWSWHIWVTDYVPVTLQGEINANTRAAAISAAQKATRNGAVQVYQGISWTDPEGSFYKSVIMDRNLGAIRAGIQNNPLDGVRTFGLLYQGGRKDPFFSTADGTTEEKKTIYDGYGVQVSIARGNTTTLDDLVRKPLTFSTNIVSYNSAGYWNGEGAKTIYDPCPDGWRVPSNGVSFADSGSTTDVSTKKCMMAGFGSDDPRWVYEETVPGFNNVMYYNGTDIVSIAKTGAESSTFVGSGIVYYGANEGPSGDTSIFFPGVSLREYHDGNYRSSVQNNSVFLWSSTRKGSTHELHIYQIQDNKLSFRHAVACMYGFSVRCVQDR